MPPAILALAAFVDPSIEGETERGEARGDAVNGVGWTRERGEGYYFRKDRNQEVGGKNESDANNKRARMKPPPHLKSHFGRDCGLYCDSITHARRMAAIYSRILSDRPY